MPAYTPQSTAGLHVKLGSVDNGAVMAASSANLAAALAFTPADVGAQVIVFGGADVKLVSTILSVTNSGHVVLNDVAPGVINPGTAIVFRPYKCRTDAPIAISISLGVKDSASFTIQSLDGSFRPARGQNVLIIDDDLGPLFGGIVDSVTASNVPGSPAVWSECQCVGFDYLLYKRTAGTLTGTGTPPNPNSGTFTNYHAGDIVAYLVTHAAGGDGLSANAIAGPIVGTVTFDYSFTVGSSIDSLLELINSTSTDLYYYYVDAWRTVQFAKMSTTAAPWNISTADGSDANVLIQVSNTTDGAKLQNRCYISEGMYLADPVTERFTGVHAADYPPAITSWETAAPLAAAPTITRSMALGQVAQTVGVDGVDTGKDFYWSLNSKTISQDSSGAQLWYGDWLDVTYRGYLEKVFGPSALLPSLANTASIDAQAAIEGGTGYYDTYLSISTPSTLAAGTSVGASIVAYFGKVPSKVEVKSYRGGLRPGQHVAVNLPEIGAVGTYMVFSVALDCSGNLLHWTYELYTGALIGDYRAALKLAFGGAGSNAGSVTAALPNASGFPLPWSPGYVAPLVGDAVYPKGLKGPGNFGVQPAYGADGSLSLPIKGTPPINKLSALTAAVLPPSIACVVGTSGNLAPGTYIVAVSAFDTGSPVANTGYSNQVPVTIPAGASTGSIALTVTWQTGSNGGDIFMALASAETGFHRQSTMTVGQTTATLAAFDASTEGGPDPLADHLAVKWTKIVHGGSWAQQVQAVTGTVGTSPGKITIADPANGTTLNQWAGSVLMLLSKYDLSVEIKILNMPVFSNTAASGGSFVLTIGPNSVGDQLVNLTTLLAVGDLVEMRMNPTFTANGFSDANIANTYYPSGATGVEAGHLAMMMDGPDAGDVQTVASVSLDGSGHHTVVNLAGSWKVQPNNGDRVIIVEPSWSPEIKTQPLSVPSKACGSSVLAQPNVLSLAGGEGAWLFMVATEDGNDARGDDARAPVREIYLLAAGATRAVAT